MADGVDRALGADVRLLNRYLYSSTLSPTSEVRIARCPKDNWAAGRKGFYEVTGTSYASGHIASFNDLKKKFWVPGVSLPRALPGDTIKTTAVLSPAKLVAGAEKGAYMQVLNPPSEESRPEDYKTFWWHHRRNAFAMLMVDSHVAYQVFKPGEVEGKDYTFDEKERTP
jgi:hypothetical protein